MEQFKFNAGDYLKKQLGMSEQSEKPELPEQEKKEVVEAMTIGKMEEFKELLNNMDVETFLGLKKLRGWDEYAKKQQQEEQDLIKKFLSAKENLDSNTKEKLYGHIFEENWKPKLEEAFNKITEELKELEIILKGKKDPNSLSEEEKKTYEYLSSRLITKTALTRTIDAELKKLEEFGFDEQRLNGLKEQLKILKRPPKKA